MAWWTFDKEIGLTEYELPLHLEPDSQEIKGVPEGLGFGKLSIIEVGGSHVSGKNGLWIECYEPMKEEPKVPFNYLVWLRLGYSYVQGVFLGNFSELLEFFKYIADLPKIFPGNSYDSANMINSTLSRIADKIDDVSNSIDDLDIRE